MTTTGHIFLARPIPITVTENQFFITIRLRDGDPGERLREVEEYFRENPQQLDRLLGKGEICLGG